MQSYGDLFAWVYNQKWQSYANRIAPLILAFYKSTPLGKVEKTLLDLCCGTGQLSACFLENGYRVVGLDLSDGMLQVARQNLLPYVVARQACFIQGDAANFELDQVFGLIVSTFDALNHLPDLNALRGCFRSAYRVLVPGGYFVFDLNTKLGLNNWNSISVDPGDEIFLLNRGIFDQDSDRAWTRITGFVRNPEGLYQRFEQTVYNTVYDLQQVMDCLFQDGFPTCYFATGTALHTPIENSGGVGENFYCGPKINCHVCFFIKVDPLVCVPARSGLYFPVGLPDRSRKSRAWEGLYGNCAGSSVAGEQQLGRNHSDEVPGVAVSALR